MKLHLALLVVAAASMTPGCIWDPDFFDDYAEAGAPAPVLDGGADGPDRGADGPDTGGPPAPSVACDARCGLVALVGTGRVAGLAADEGGGAWLIVSGAVADARPVTTDEAFDPAAPSHLVHIAGGDFAIDQITPLPFEATGLAASRVAVFVTGYALRPGTLLERTLESTGRGAIVARISDRQVQWLVTFSSTEPPRLGSSGPTAVWVTGKPAATAFHLDDGPDAMHTGDPMAAGPFVARLDGLGRFGWLRQVGGGFAIVDAFGAGAGEQSAVVVRGGGGLDDGTPLDREATTLVTLDPRGERIGLAAWPATSLSINRLALDGGGRVWALASAGADLGLPIEPPGASGRAALVVERDGTVTAGAALGAPRGGSLDALAVGARALVLGQALGEDPTTLGAAELPGAGLFMAAVDDAGAVSGLVRLGPASGNAPSGRAAAVDATHAFVAADVYAEVELDGQIAPYDGRPMVVVMRLPLP